MTSDRPYREALGREALDELRKNMDKQFDPRVARALVEVVKVPHLLPSGKKGRMTGEALFARGRSATKRLISEDHLDWRSVYARRRGS